MALGDLPVPRTTFSSFFSRFCAREEWRSVIPFMSAKVVSRGCRTIYVQKVVYTVKNTLASTFTQSTQWDNPYDQRRPTSE